MAGTGAREIAAADGALRAGMSRERLIRKIQTKAIKGRRDPERGWLVLEASLDAYLRSRSDAESLASR